MTKMGQWGNEAMGQYENHSRLAPRAHFRIAPLPHCLIASLLAVAACTSGPPPPDQRPYEQQIASARARKDADFRAADDSPIPVAARAAFAGLPYFAVDPAYRVPAHVTENRKGPPIVITLQTSTSVPRKMRTVGILGFSIGGAEYTLTAFADEDASTLDRLFVPFGDLTNGAETYKAGRYLDLERTPTGLYDLDFNRAYHPYCVYNPKYECPIPPKENRLQVAISAGERLKVPGS